VHYDLAAWFTFCAVYFLICVLIELDKPHGNIHCAYLVGIFVCGGLGALAVYGSR
jgi:hypothetical protein